MFVDTIRWSELTFSNELKARQFIALFSICCWWRRSQAEPSHHEVMYVSTFGRGVSGTLYLNRWAYSILGNPLGVFHFCLLLRGRWICVRRIDQVGHWNPHQGITHCVLVPVHSGKWPCLGNTQSLRSGPRLCVGVLLLELPRQQFFFGGWAYSRFRP